jgi:hypothetical protein
MRPALQPSIFAKVSHSVLRYIYGAIAFIGVVALVFGCRVALQRVWGENR